METFVKMVSEVALIMMEKMEEAEGALLKIAQVEAQVVIADSWAGE